MGLDLIAGKRRVGAVTNLAGAGNANAVAIMTLSTFAGMQGVKSFVIKRLKVRSNAVGADTWLHIGTGVAGAVVDIIPALRIINNTTDDYDEYDLPEVEVPVTIMAYPDAVGGGSLDVQVEVEEKG
jgi:hypothetical protein